MLDMVQDIPGFQGKIWRGHLPIILSMINSETVYDSNIVIFSQVLVHMEGIQFYFWFWLHLVHIFFILYLPFNHIARILFLLPSSYLIIILKFVSGLGNISRILFITKNSMLVSQHRTSCTKWRVIAQSPLHLDNMLVPSKYFVKIRILQFPSFT